MACCKPRVLLNQSDGEVKLDRLPDNYSDLLSNSPTCIDCGRSMKELSKKTMAGGKEYTQYTCQCGYRKGTFT